MIRKQAPWISAAPRPASASTEGAPRAAFACAPTCGLVVRPRPFRAHVFPTASRNARATSSRERCLRAASSSSRLSGPGRRCCHERELASRCPVGSLLRHGSNARGRNANIIRLTRPRIRTTETCPVPNFNKTGCGRRSESVVAKHRGAAISSWCIGKPEHRSRPHPRSRRSRETGSSRCTSCPARHWWPCKQNHCRASVRTGSRRGSPHHHRPAPGRRMNLRRENSRQSTPGPHSS